jgi:type IV pilus assembly protein PilQ
MTQEYPQTDSDHGFPGRAAARALVAVLLAGVFAAAGANTLDNASYSALPGDRVQLKLDFSEPLAEEPVNFTIDNPARIAIDLPGIGLRLPEKSQSIGIGMAHSLAAVEAGGRTRVVVNLVRPVSYDMELQGNSLIVTLGSAVAGAEMAAPAAGMSAGAAMPGEGGSIEDIDFRRGDNGEGRVIITLSDPSVGVNLGQESGQIVADFMGATLPAELDRKLDVVDFATPVKIIDTKPHAGGTRMTISTTTDQYDHLAYQADNTFTIEVRPLTAEQQEAMKKEKFGFTGERLSLNFQDIEVRAVLQLIADFTGLNLVASDTVRGSVTLRLKNVPWDQALDIILRARGLGMRQDGNVMMVAPQEEIAAREKLELESQKQVEELAPLRTEFVQINYAKAADLAKLISSDENSLLSDRGTVSIDERTNTLIIQDVAASLEAIRDMVAKLDIPIRQVLIESRIVNADESFTRDLGVKFGGSRLETSAGGLVPGKTVWGAGGTRPGGVVDAENGSGFQDVDGDDGLLVNLPVPGATSSLAFAIGKIGTYLLQLELTALLAEGRGEEIANPKVITANQSEASIESGVEIPYQSATSSGATSVSFKKAVLSLRVTPQITPDNRVLLDLEVNQDTRGAPDVLGTPPINTRSVITQVLVDDGETVVLGGIYNQVDRKSTDRVPFFSDVPVLGVLFKKNRVEKSRTELLIFVTPKILREDLAI